jgi:signal transduction histidine kinase
VTAEVEAGAKNQKLSLEIDPALSITADQYLLFTAVSNLVQNAIKYTCPGGTIRIRGSVLNEGATIEVEDECGGLGTVTPSDLFKPYEQQHRNREGVGLGLTIAQRAVELNDGTIDVQDLPGRGCIFKINLPGMSSRDSNA